MASVQAMGGQWLVVAAAFSVRICPVLGVDDRSGVELSPNPVVGAWPSGKKIDTDQLIFEETAWKHLSPNPKSP